MASFAAQITCIAPGTMHRPVKHASHSRRAAVVLKAQAGAINPDIEKDNPKVATTVSTGDFEKQAVYCRCWRSATFPLCNGAHVKHNKETGDNVGPLIIKKE